MRSPKFLPGLDFIGGLVAHSEKKTPTYTYGPKLNFININRVVLALKKTFVVISKISYTYMVDKNRFLF